MTTMQDQLSKAVEIHNETVDVLCALQIENLKLPTHLSVDNCIQLSVWEREARRTLCAAIESIEEANGCKIPFRSIPPRKYMPYHHHVR